MLFNGLDRKRHLGYNVLIILVVFSLSAEGLGDLSLPPEETAIKNDVDHWGLAFSDQLRIFGKNFQNFAKAENQESPDYILGIETSLRKTFKNKYWFKGKIINVVELNAAKNESEAFQLAIIPNTGFELDNIKISVSEFKAVNSDATISRDAVKLWRVGFVETAPAQYPTQYGGYWPDPLLELETFSLNGLDLGLVWVEIKVPHKAVSGDYIAKITVKPENSAKTELEVRLHVWDFALPSRVPIPTMVWIRGDMQSDEYRDTCALFLKHHIDPISVGKTDNLDLLDENLGFCIEQGLMRFETPAVSSPEKFKSYYEHIKEKGWLDKALVYSPADEPLENTFREVVIPRTTMIRKEFPGLNTFLATQYYNGLDEGTDIWLADVSTNFHHWLNKGRPGKQTLYWYFCKLPIRVELERNITNSSLMLIDRDAIEHRVVYWMAHYYQVHGIFIYGGNIGQQPQNDKLSTQKMNFPYGGIHNGNGFLVYPGPKPSIRLKVLRDGIEDYWYLVEAARLAQVSGNQQKAKNLLSGVRPEVFVDTHYFSRDPEDILGYRKKLAEFIETATREND